MVDMWQWKASRGGMLGRVDDQFIGPPYEPSKDEAAYMARYQGGYWNDPGRTIYSYNYKFFSPKEYQGPVEVIKLPKDWKKTQDQLGKISFDPNTSDVSHAKSAASGARRDMVSKSAKFILETTAAVSGEPAGNIHSCHFCSTNFKKAMRLSSGDQNAWRTMPLTRSVERPVSESNSTMVRSSPSLESDRVYSSFLPS